MLKKGTAFPGLDCRSSETKVKVLNSRAAFPSLERLTTNNVYISLNIAAQFFVNNRQLKQQQLWICFYDSKVCLSLSISASKSHFRLQPCYLWR